MQNYIAGQTPQQNQFSSSAVSPQANPQLGYKDTFYQLEQAIGADVYKIRGLVQNGTISQQEGQYLMAQLARKAQEINNYKNSMMQQQPPQQISSQPVPAQQPQSLSPMERFNQERPGFFEGDGRADVLNYIQGLDMDKDEILRISQLVEKLENSAVDKYMKQSAYEKSLNDENALAKSKLTSYAQNANGENTLPRIFTREDIGNMSGEEFARNEKAIFEQVRKGLIK